MQSQYIDKFYPNIANYELNSLLFEIKEIISKIPSLNKEIRFKIEFILEELLTNSFSHLELNRSPIDIKINLFIKKFRIEYQEIGVDDLNFDQILMEGKEKNLSPALHHIGGLGLNLIQQISKKLNYRYDKSIKTRYIEVLFS